MRTATSWVRGGLVGVLLTAPAAGAPARHDASANLVAVAEVPALETEPPHPEPAAPAAGETIDAFPARTYGNLDDASCMAQLEERGISYEPLDRHARGVRTPVRLLGALHGVRFRHAALPDFDASARREILDCRLVLALDDLAAILARRGYTTVLHYGVYRGDLALPTRGPVLHHSAALAIDVASFVKDDGTHLDVRRDWRRSWRGHTCENGAPEDDSQPSHELRGILCEVARAKLFHEVLTPNHDAHHWDHFHLEVMRHEERTIVD